MMQGQCSSYKTISVICHSNKVKDKNHMIISIDAEKVFHKIHPSFITKLLNNMTMEKIPQHNKVYIQQNHS